MLESGGEAGEDLVMFHVKLLRKLKKSVTIEKWEKGLTRLDANLERRYICRRIFSLRFTIVLYKHPFLEQ